MPSTFSQSLRLELIASGSQSGVWGVTTNNNLGDLVEQAISGETPLNVTSADITLAALNGVVDQARSAVLLVTGTPGTTRVLTIPNVQKNYTVKNRSNATVQLKTATGVAFDVPTLAEAYVYCDGDNVITGRSITDAANAFTSNTAPLNNTALTGVPTAPTAAPGTSTTQIATTAFVQTALPIGSVIMWFGTVGAIPAGWQVCDGTNGTPDLRDRFVVGAGSAYALGNTGGADTVTLTTAQIPSHTHSISGSGTTANANISHTHTFSGTTGGQSVNHTHSGSTDVQGVHNHNTIGGGSLAAGGGYRAATSDFTRATDAAGAHNHNFTTNSASNDHVHSLSGTTAAADPVHAHTFSFSGTSGGTGGGNAHENRPPYFALLFIMRV
jgi:microcystin-dependent protein